MRILFIVCCLFVYSVQARSVVEVKYPLTLNSFLTLFQHSSLSIIRQQRVYFAAFHNQAPFSRVIIRLRLRDKRAEIAVKLRGLSSKEWHELKQLTFSKKYKFKCEVDFNLVSNYRAKSCVLKRFFKKTSQLKSVSALIKKEQRHLLSIFTQQTMEQIKTILSQLHWRGGIFSTKYRWQKKTEIERWCWQEHCILELSARGDQQEVKKQLLALIKYYNLAADNFRSKTEWFFKQLSNTH